MTTLKIAAITGGAGALGSTLAKLLVTKGYQVALLDTERAKDRLANLATELGGTGVASAHVGDFATAETWKGALESVERVHGALPTHAALIAGGWGGGVPLHAIEDDTYERMIRTNVDTAYRALRALLPDMVAKKHGSIVVVGSRAVERPWTSTNAAAYAASKAATVTLAQTAAEEVLAHGVRINAILPSTMDTPANRAAMPNVDPDKWVSLESAARVIAFLLSKKSRDISGAAIPVYGRA